MKNKHTTFRANLHYASALVFISIYGVQVCPFIESLTPIQLAIPLIAIIFLQYLLRYFIAVPFIDKSDYKLQVKRSFQLEWGLFILSGFILTAVNSLYYDFPLGSGMKMVLGFSTLGFFSATDLALSREYDLGTLLKEQRIQLIPDKTFFPLAGKFSVFAATSALLIVGVYFLIISKDLDWLAQVGNEIPAAQAQMSILKEFFFVGTVILGYTLLVIFSYMRNINYFLNSENSVLAEATAGDLNTSITVSSNDEFGVMAHHTNIMIRTLCKRTVELQQTQDVTIYTLASLAETRDNETGAHILRTQRYILALAKYLQHKPRFSAYLTDETIELIYKSAPLHDIGKVGIPDKILLKPGKLDESEFEIMKTHAKLGSDALKAAENTLGSNSFLSYAKEIAETHHEKWDGSGYPKGLKGEEIPISGRLMAVADVYDALISKRIYKPAFSHEKSMSILQEGKGSHFDPDIINAAVALEQEFIDIAQKYQD